MAASIGLIKMSIIGSHKQQFLVRENHQLHLPVTLTYAASMYGVHPVLVFHQTILVVIYQERIKGSNFN